MAKKIFFPGNIGEKLAQNVVQAHLLYQEVGRLYAGGYVSKESVLDAHASFVSLVIDLEKQAKDHSVLLQEILAKHSVAEEEATSAAAV